MNDNVKKVNVLEIAEETANQSLKTLEPVKLGENDTTVIFFTPDAVEVAAHYCAEKDIRDYVLCNSPECVLCQIGRERIEMVLIPVYLPISETIGVIRARNKHSARALLPQIAECMKGASNGDRYAAFITRKGGDYNVATRKLPDDADGGDEAIKKYMENVKTGVVDLSTVVSKIKNKTLTENPQINKELHYRGLLN